MLHHFGFLVQKRATTQVCILLLVGFLIQTHANAQGKESGSDRSLQNARWNEFIETDFPFFSTSMAVDSSVKEQEQLITPRTLVFPLPNKCFVAYDIDLLRVVAVWTAGEAPFENASLVVNSYPYELNKVAAGTKALPKPLGNIWFTNGSYVGVGVGNPEFTLPASDLSAEERIVNGGLDPEIGSFLGVDTRQAAIEYRIDDVRVRERFTCGKSGLTRRLRISPHRSTIYLIVARNPQRMRFACEGGSLQKREEHLVCIIEPSESEQEVSIVSLPERVRHGDSPEDLPRNHRRDVEPLRWQEAVRLELPQGEWRDSLILESIPLPTENPYGRGVRPADIDFFADGRAAIVTIDGDVWVGQGLDADSKDVQWRRFTSGLHEPLSIRVRNDELFVFDRNGLWRLLDQNLDGQADFHEHFCSRIDQTAETREFPLSLELANDGSFLISKPGQEGVFSGVVRVSQDGKDASLIATGFRQPYLGYDPVTDRIVATDQQGNWVPSTPVHLIEAGGFYGFRRSKLLDDRPVTPPLTWIPHAECGSATTVVWTRGAELGGLNDKPILLSYNPPRLLQLHIDDDGKIVQGGATPIALEIGSRPILKARVNPADGLMYLVGFKIWGTSAEQVTFLGRVRANADRRSTIPEFARVERRGILLSFSEAIDLSTAMRRESFQVRRWNYKRTAAYGSGNYRLDGQPGTETLGVSSVMVSNDRKSVFLGVQDMRPAMQIEVTYDLAFGDGMGFMHQTFLTANGLRDIDLAVDGFPSNEVDLDSAPLAQMAEKRIEPTIQYGAQLYSRVGCAACHSIDGTVEGKNGPSWLALFNSERVIEASGELVKADEAYLRESILNPSAKVAKGAINGEAGMPVYEGVLNDDQIDSLVLFIKALTDKDQAEQLLSDTKVVETRTWKIEDFTEEMRLPLKGRSFSQGKTAFLGASCFSCHQIGEGKGGILGPDLSKLDDSMTGRELLIHILDPSLRIEDKYKQRTILTNEGEIYSGYVISENETEVRLSKDPLSNAEPVVISNDEIEQQKLAAVSPMPSGTLNTLDRQQVLDLLAYIESRGDPSHPVFAK